MKKIAILILFTFGLSSCEQLIPSEPTNADIYYKSGWLPNDRSTQALLHIYVGNKAKKTIDKINFYILLKDGNTIKKKKEYYNIGPILPNEELKLDGFDSAFIVSQYDFVNEYINYRDELQIISVTWK